MATSSPSDLSTLPAVSNSIIQMHDIAPENLVTAGTSSFNNLFIPATNSASASGFVPLPLSTDGQEEYTPVLTEDLQRKMQALQQKYQQEQQQLLNKFRETQFQLALQHYHYSQQILHDYQEQLSKSACDVRMKKAAAVFHETSGDSNSSTAQQSPRLHRSNSQGNSAGVVSQQTKERLKQMIYNRQNNRQKNMSTSETGTQSDDYELRKTSSEPNLKARSALKLKHRCSPLSSAARPSPPKRHLDEDSVQEEMSEVKRVSHGPAMPLFPSPSMPNLAFYGTPAGPQYPPPLSAYNWFGSLPNVAAQYRSLLLRATAPPSQPQAPSSRIITGGPSASTNQLKTQLRNLVMRRQSLVKEETDEEIRMETAGDLSINLPSEERDRTGITYDTCMNKHSCACRNQEIHLEHAGRTQSIWARLVERGLAARCQKMEGRKATLEELTLVHAENYVLFFGWTKLDLKQLPVKSFTRLPCGGIGVDLDTYFNETTTGAAARTATGSLIDLCAKVAQNRLRNGFAIIRPPGHHAERNQALGFCYFNHVAVAAKSLRLKYGIDKLAIVDWDVHHGNGTQAAFEDDPSVLFISFHRHDDGNFFPGTGALTDVGQGEGRGFSINIAWSGEAMGDAEYLAGWRSVAEPALTMFQPEMILVSAGFDGTEGHSANLGGYALTPALYAFFTRELMTIANGRVVLSLEGGYDLPSLCDCAEVCTKVLLGEAPIPLPMESLARKPNPSAVTSLKILIAAQQRFWPSLTDHYVDITHMEFEALNAKFQNLTVQRRSSSTPDQDQDQIDDI